VEPIRKFARAAAAVAAAAAAFEEYSYEQLSIHLYCKYPLQKTLPCQYSSEILLLLD
jgi:hypothetical protein